MKQDAAEPVGTKQQNEAGRGQRAAGTRRGEAKSRQSPMGKSEQRVADKANGAVRVVARRLERGEARHGGCGEDRRSCVPSGTLRRAE